MSTHSSLLIIGPSWVGDMVMAQTLLKCLQEKHPESHIDVLAPAWSAPLTQRMPEVSQTIEFSCAHGELGLKKRYALGKTLKGKYEKAYILPNSFKSALIPFFASIPKRIGYRREMRDLILTQSIKLDKSSHPLMFQRFAALAAPEKARDPKALPWPRLNTKEAEVQKALEKHKLHRTTRVLALCPGAEFGPSKRWPSQHFVKVSQYALKKGWQVWLFGSKQDQDIASSIEQGCEGAIKNLAGQTTLAEAIDLLSQVDAVVSNDSGLMHIAAALQKPIVALFGSTSPKFTPPLADQILIHQTELPCRPCFKRVCPLKHHACMETLEVGPVIEAFEDFAA